MNSFRSFFFKYFFWSLAIIFGVLSTFLYYNSSHFLESNLVKDHEKLLENIIRNVNSHYRGRLRSLELLAYDLNGANVSSAEKNKISLFLKYETLISSIHIYDTKGTLLYADKKQEVPKYSIGKTVFENAPGFSNLVFESIKDERSVLSPIFLTKHKNVYQTYIVPIRNHKQKIEGVMSGAIFPYLTDLKHTVEGLSLGQDNHLILVANSGHIITDSLDEKHYSYSKNHELIKDYIKDYLAGSLPSENQGPLIPLVKKDPQSESYYFLFVSRNKVIEQKRKMLHYATIAFLLSLILGFAITLYTSSKISQPIYKIQQSLNSALEGDFSSKIEDSGNDILSQLCRDFNKLLKEIEKDKYIATLWSGKWPSSKDKKEYDTF